jgi:hypothetical protein
LVEDEETGELVPQWTFKREATSNGSLRWNAADLAMHLKAIYLSLALPCAPSKTVRTLHAALHADVVVRRTHAGSPSEANSLHAILLSALPRWIGPPH